MENTINEDGKWKVLSSEYLIRRPWLTARRDVAQLPDGRINHEYYVLEYPDWVNIIAITEDGEVILEMQYRHGLGNTCYELPCGVIEAGETPLQAAQRELLEETGFAGGEWRHLMGLSPNPASEQVHIYSIFGMSHIEAYDATGRRVYIQKSSGHEALIDTRSWPSGTYLLAVGTSLGLANKKLIIRR